MEEFERNLRQEIEKLQPGASLRRSETITLDSRTAENVNNIKESLASLFGLAPEAATNALILIQLEQTMLSAKCLMKTSFVELTKSVTKELYASKHIAPCEPLSSASSSSSSTSSEQPSLCYPLVNYSIIEFRIIQTDATPHLHPIVWLKASVQSSAPDEETKKTTTTQYVAT